MHYYLIVANVFNPTDEYYVFAIDIRRFAERKVGSCVAVGIEWISIALLYEHVSLLRKSACYYVLRLFFLSFQVETLAVL